MPIVEHPTPEQWEIATEASRRAMMLADPYEAHYWRGAAAGYMAAFNDHELWADLHTQARNTYFAKPWPYAEVRPLMAFLPTTGPAVRDIRDRVYASGLLWAYKEATADLDDAAECISCDQRILLRRQAEHVAGCRVHGVFCADECRRTVCGPWCETQDDQFEGPPTYAGVW